MLKAQHYQYMIAKLRESRVAVDAERAVVDAERERVNKRIQILECGIRLIELLPPEHKDEGELLLSQILDDYAEPAENIPR